MTTLLRYPGGKARLARWVLAHLAPHAIYVEPYAGGASVLLNKICAQHEVLNDIDDEIVNLLRVMRDPRQSAELVRLLKLTPDSRTEFIECKKRFPKIMEPV